MYSIIFNAIPKAFVQFKLQRSLKYVRNIQKYRLSTAGQGLGLGRAYLGTESNELFSGVSNKYFQLVNKMQHGTVSHEDIPEDELVSVAFITKDGKRFEVKGKVGENALYLAQRQQIEMEGACEASLACTTCHVYVNDQFFDSLPPAEEKEEDLLDMAPFLKPNSRLGCQIILTKEMNGIELTLPAATRNFYVDGHKPQPH